MSSIIRKISIGPDYMNSMSYHVGQEIRSLGYTIKEIKRDDDYEIHIYVVNGDRELFCWKTITPSVPVSIEYNLDF